jgi:DNA-binding SARP family transcriptional activator/tetratricopeptide (TPR) repeat protein
VKVQVLGPVRVRIDGEPFDLGPRQYRLVLAILALDAGTLVTVDRLVDLIWRDGPPRTARHAVRVAVSGLRAAFAAAGVPLAELEIRAEGTGYLLAADPKLIDAHHFRRLLAQARDLTDGQGRVALYDEALGLWSGEPEFAGTGLFAGLIEARLTATEDRIDAKLRLGLHHEVLDELTGLAAAHPLRERLAGQLMLGLHRTGRASEALAVYQRIRTALAEEVGLDPGSDLRRIEGLVLRDESDGPAAPATLPHVAAGFTGRRDALAALDAATATATVVSVGGIAGVGKTSLVVHWAALRRDRFPDGVLYVDLAGYAPERSPMTAGQVLDGFLRALGLPAERIPADPDQAGALYRSQVAHRTMLVVLDNAVSAAQVRPLLPAGPRCVTVVTARDRLDGLVARDGASALRLDVLTPAESTALLVRLLGAGRVAAEPDAVRELGMLCGHLPLALRIAAAHLARHQRGRIADLAADLHDGDRLTVLRVPGDPQTAVRASFDLSYAALGPLARRVFRLAGVALGPDVSFAALVALTGLDSATLRSTVEELTAAYLLDERIPVHDGHYATHNLLDEYRRALLAPAESAEATARLEDWCLGRARSAARWLYPQMQRLPAEPSPMGDFADGPAAMRWLESDRATLVAVVGNAAVHHRPVAWLLADALRGYFWMRRHGDDWLTVAGAALRAASAAGEYRGAAAAHLSLAQAYRWLQHLDTAVEHLTAAEGAARKGDWPQGEAAALGTLGNVLRDQGRLAESGEYHRRAGLIYHGCGEPAGEAVSTGNLGNVLMDSGRPAEALEALHQALSMYRDLGARTGEAHTLNSLGCTLRVLGRLDEAAARLREALALHRSAGSREGEADDLNNLAEVARDASRPDEALDLARESLVLAVEAADGRLEADARNTIGSCLARRDPVAARDEHRTALRLSRGSGYRQGELRALTGLAVACTALDATAEAAEYAAEASAVEHRTGFRLV